MSEIVSAHTIGELVRNGQFWHVQLEGREICINEMPRFKERCPVTSGSLGRGREQEYSRGIQEKQERLAYCFEQIVGAIAQLRFYDTCHITTDYEHQEVRFVFCIKTLSVEPEHSIVCQQFTKDNFQILQPGRVFRNVENSAEVLSHYIRGSRVEH